IAEPDNFALEKIQPAVLAVLVALGKKQLKPQANAQERLARSEMSDQRIDHAGFVQPGDGVAKRADSRQDHLAGVSDGIRVAGNLGYVPDLLQGLLDAPKIPHAVIDDNDRAHLCVPQPSHESNEISAR